jgi:transcriptional regulator with XRE-family HTH domain
MKSINLKRLQGRYITLVNAYINKERISQKELATKIGQNESILCDLLNNKRVLSALYLLPALNGGVMGVEEIYDGQPLNDQEQKFWARERLLENVELVNEATEIIELGGNPVQILQLHKTLLKKS